MDNKSELNAHFNRNKEMWNIWEQNGITSETELTVNFHFYTTKKDRMEELCKILKEKNIPYKTQQTRTMIFFKGWLIDTDITKKWTLPELQGKTEKMFLLGDQVGVSLEGCGAFMPK